MLGHEGPPADRENPTAFGTSRDGGASDNPTPRQYAPVESGTTERKVTSLLARRWWGTGPFGAGVWQSGQRIVLPEVACAHNGFGHALHKDI